MTLLGLLSSKPMYGYEIRQQMQIFDMEAWIDIKPGSIYSALPRMAAEGLLEVVDVSSAGNRPIKTVYAITAAGRTELLRLIRQAWAVPSGTAQPVDVALFFMWLLPPDEVAAQLAERVRILAGVQAHVARNRAAALAPVGDSSGGGATSDVRPPQYVEMMTDLLDHAKEMVETELRWSERMLRRVQDGVFNFGNDTQEGGAT
jgi:DNA-binding PadR family transcriptional regulator